MPSISEMLRGNARVSATVPAASIPEAVAGGSEMDRIMQLPRRPIVDCERERLMGGRLGAYPPASVALAEYVTAQLARTGVTKCACAELGHRCITMLNPAQAWVLRELAKVGGIHGFISVGAGKCLPAGNEVFDMRNARRRDVSEAGTLAVPAYNAQIVQSDATCFASGQKNCCRVLLADGTSFTASLDHPVLTARGWVDAGQLKSDDFVAVANSIPEPQVPTRASDDEVALVAFMLSDGGCSQGTPSFTNETTVVISEFQRLAEKLCVGFSENRPTSKARQFKLLGSNGRSANGVHGTGFRAKWDLFGLARDKRLHPTLWGLPRRQVALFINRFWACDGHVSFKDLEITLASEKLIDDLQFLLLRLGVRARKHYKAAMLNGVCFDAWRLQIAGADALVFLNSVGDVLGKEEASIKLRHRLCATKRNTNTDVVPVGDAEFKFICDELGLARRGFSRRSGNGRPRTTLRKKFSVTQGQYISRTKFIELCKTTGYKGKYSPLASEELRWERLATLEEIGMQTVFDLEVPGPHNFAVGSGSAIVHNSIMGILAPLVVPGCRTVVLLGEPSQRIHYRNFYLRLREHFRVPSIVFSDDTTGFVVPGSPVLHFVPYSRLSRPDATDLLERLNPDMIIADEAHRVSAISARTRRLMRYFASHPNTKLCDWSGTLMRKSIRDQAHLAAYALRLGSPLPVDPDVVEEWSSVIDPTRTPDRTSSTAKTLFKKFANINLENSPFVSTDGLRKGLQKRIVETPGVISTKASSIGASIYLRERKAPPIPPEVMAALNDVRERWLRPDGEELVEALDQAKCIREVACGFHSYWAYPKGESPELILEWFEKRKRYNKELRSRLMMSEPHLDSPQLCEHAAVRAWKENPAYVGELPLWKSAAWPAWSKIKDKVDPDPRSKWIKDAQGNPVGEYLAHDAAAWAKEHRGIVWCMSRAFGKKVADIAGLTYHGGGPDAEANILAEDGSRSIVASIKAHGTGRDQLQHRFSEQLIAEVPSGGDIVEQLLGRLHRDGQDADCIETWIYLHVPEVKEALRKAIREAEFAESTTGNKQKILLADCEFSL